MKALKRWEFSTVNKDSVLYDYRGCVIIFDDILIFRNKPKTDEYDTKKSNQIQIKIAMKTSNFKLQLQGTTLVRNVDSQRHYFVKFRAYAFDADELKKYENKWKKLEIYTTRGVKYSISYDSFVSHSFVNSEYGKTQIMIKVADMDREEKQTGFVRLPIDLYERLKAESKRTRKPMNTLLKLIE